MTLVDVKCCGETRSLATRMGRSETEHEKLVNKYTVTPGSYTACRRTQRCKINCGALSTIDERKQTIDSRLSNLERSQGRDQFKKTVESITALKDSGTVASVDLTR
jgi:hypothetical protein